MMMGVGGARPAMPVDFGWKDYVEVFDGIEGVSSASVAGVFGSGYEYRLMFDGAATSSTLSNGYNELKISATHQSGYLFYGATLAYIYRSRVYGEVNLGAFGDKNRSYSIQNNLYLSNGRLNEYNCSKYINAGNPVEVVGLSISANPDATLTGSCMLQRRRIST